MLYSIFVAELGCCTLSLLLSSDAVLYLVLYSMFSSDVVLYLCCGCCTLCSTRMLSAAVSQPGELVRCLWEDPAGDTLEPGTGGGNHGDPPCMS